MSEHLWSLATPKGVRLDAVSRGGTPEWTAADLGVAASGLPYFKFRIALFTLAGDDNSRGSVRTYLLEKLLEAQERLQWKRRVERIDGFRSRFAEELVGLYLDEERRPSVFQAAPNLRSTIMRVEPETWRRDLSHQYQYVAAEFQVALIEAEEHVRRKVRRSA